VGERSGPTSSSRFSVRCGCSRWSPSATGGCTPRRSPGPPGCRCPPLTTTAHPRPRGLPPASRRRLVRARPPTRRREPPRHGRTRGGARPPGAGVAARRTAQLHLPRPARGRGDLIVEIVDGPKARGSTCGSGCTTPPTPRRWASRSSGNCCLRTARTTSRGTAARPHAPHRRRPAQVTAASPDAVAVDDEEYAVGVRCLAAPLRRRPARRARVRHLSRALRDRTGARQALSTCAARVSRALSWGEGGLTGRATI